MCGIVGMVIRGGNSHGSESRKTIDYLLNGLDRLEYRGYDSAGVALIGDDGLIVEKRAVGAVSNLRAIVNDIDGDLGIAHTRWATHGEPSVRNSHPHISNCNRIGVVHNGIIENYQSIKQKLVDSGIRFRSDTDSEVIPNLIATIIGRDYGDIEITSEILKKVVIEAIKEFKGNYAFIVISTVNPNVMVAVKCGAPLIVGEGSCGYYVASDKYPLKDYADEALFLKKDSIVTIDREKGIKLFNLNGTPVEFRLSQLPIYDYDISKGTHPFYMEKEIFEQPQALREALNGRVDLINSRVNLPELEHIKDQLKDASRIIIIACGTSYHAALVAEYVFEKIALIPTEVEYASEFRYRDPIVREDDVVIAISQSGETADTISALNIAKEKGATTVAICNNDNSSMTILCDAYILTHAGMEIGVASTKAFSTQLMVLYLTAIYRSQITTGSEVGKDIVEILNGLVNIPNVVEESLQIDEDVSKISHYFAYVKNFLFLGRGVLFPIALEGALKLKEISYIHAEGYPAAEMKHGPIALIDFDMPTIVVANNNDYYEKIVSNAKEISARNGRIISIVREGDCDMADISDISIEVPEVLDILSPFIATIPLQLFSYHTAIAKGCDVDKPRNLAKAVTVE